MDKLISSAEAFKVLSEYYHHKTPQQAEALLEALQSVPEGVVRCKDCIHGDGLLPCVWGGSAMMKDIDYCSRGERRTDA